MRSVRSLLPATPSAILIVTAHRESALPSFIGGTNPELIYDYDGFPPETNTLQYKAPGHPALAQRAATLLRAAGHPATVDPHYGWDHGVFIPLKVRCPDADVPIVAMSLQAGLGLDPTLHCELGAALQSLREEGVLIVGSGMSFHNLQDFVACAPASFVFHDGLDSVLSGNRDERTLSLARWRSAPVGRASHPREAHLMPLMVASAAGSDLPARGLWRGAVGPSCLAAWAFD